MMTLSGYRKKKNKCLELSEATIMCTHEELDTLIEFFIYCKKHFSNTKNINMTEIEKDPVLGYEHYSDWCKKKSIKNDLIVAVSMSTEKT